MARMRGRGWLTVGLLCITLIGGCGDTADDGVTGKTTDTSPEEDTSAQLEDTGAAADTGAAEDTTPEEDTSTAADTSSQDTSTADTGDECPGGDYCPCNTNDDCDQGYCIDSPEGRVCAQKCVDTCKKEGFVCKLVPGPGGDNVSVCVPEAGNLCNPCNKNEQCSSLSDSGAACVDLGDSGAFCGSSCAGDTDCPADYVCGDVKDVTGKEVKQCVVKGGGACACSKDAIAKELSTKCFVSNDSATCEGVRTCLPDGKEGAPAGGGLSACLAPTPIAEQCNGKDDDCDGDTDEATCDDNEVCTDDSCDPASGCKNVNKTGPCDADGSVCTKDDACKDGKCVTGESIDCDDKNPCTKDVCDAKDGCKYSNDDDKPCNADDTACTVSDKCKEGKCIAGEVKACSSNDQCVEGKCNIADGKCTYKFQEAQACNDGNPCTIGEKCKDGGCEGTAAKCDDNNACTADSCAKATGCTHTAITSPCNDDNACTAQDACKDKKCVGQPVDGAVKCNDNNACTKDACDPIKGCLNSVLTGDKCDDGNPCTSGDTCENGTCKSGKNLCSCTTDSDCKDDGNLCNGTLYCDKSAGAPYKCKVDPKTVVTCDTTNDNFCATTTCVPATGKCAVNKKSNGTACDADKSVCTSGDQCVDGLCKAGANVNCDDKNGCTNDSCNPATGCVFIANTDPCDADGDACTVGDICSAKSCIAGKKTKCDDGEPCTSDSCNKTTGKCEVKPLTTACDDNNACTVGDKCGKAKDGKWTCVAGTKKDCDDSNPCTKDSCDALTGCDNAVTPNVTVDCYTGDPKTKGVGVCVGGKQTCDSNGKLGKCNGEVTPAAKDICGDSKDNTCEGNTDEGCAPTGYQARFGNSVLTGQVVSGGKKYDARLFVGGSAVIGDSKGTKNSASFGFYQWLSALLGK